MELSPRSVQEGKVGGYNTSSNPLLKSTSFKAIDWGGPLMDGGIHISHRSCFDSSPPPLIKSGTSSSYPPRSSFLSQLIVHHAADAACLQRGVLQSNPSHPSGQEHLSGARQLPPFEHR